MGVGGINSIIRWFLALTLEEFCEVKSSYLLLQKYPDKDLLVSEKGKYVTWKSHSKSGYDAQGVIPIPQFYTSEKPKTCFI